MFSLIVPTIEWYTVVPLGLRNTPHLLRLKTYQKLNRLFKGHHGIAVRRNMPWI